MRYSITNLKSKGEWVKFWAIKLHLLTGSIICEDCTKYMEKQLGINLKNLVVVSKEGYTASYALVKDRTEVGKYFIKKFVKENSAKEIAALIKSKALDLSAKLKELLEKGITEHDLKILMVDFDEYHNLHIIPRAMIDAASPGLAEKIIADLRDARLAGETIHQDFDNLLSRFFEKISEKTGCSPDEMLSLTRCEFLEYLDKHKLPKQEELAKRYKDCGLLITNKDSICTTDLKTIGILEHLNVNIQDSGLIEGRTAFAGKATGVVRIVYDPAKCEVFNKGDILVTGMTRPDYVPLMEKAAAIVTDSGGLLCHAAIVARELGKPCIIGTQSATKLLKDGDLVEVDAEKGIVRKLKK